MKMSSRGSGLKGSTVTQHRPDHVHSPTGKRDERLDVPLALCSLSVVEGPGLR